MNKKDIEKLAEAYEKVDNSQRPQEWDPTIAAKINPMSAVANPAPQQTQDNLSTYYCAHCEMPIPLEQVDRFAQTIKCPYCSQPLQKINQ